ncbi:MAG TPA: glycosyltransferase family 1 protein [Bryobacteraceae bacterium]|nr:glycosyltransferase family 1 protein [Bryobacteraceae bacterium]
MRLCVDATPLLLRSAGVKTYIHSWVEALRRATPAPAISLFPFFSGTGPLDHEKSMAPGLPTFRGLALLHAMNYLHLPALDWAAGRWDVFHSSHQLQNPPRSIPLTTTIHDMTCWLMPELHRARNVEFSRRFGESVMPRAAGLIAVSESTRRDAIRILRLDPERVVTIHSGVDARFFNPVPAIRARPYFLFVGTIEPRKNIGTLLDAWLALPAGIREEYELVVAGPKGWGEEQVMARLAAGIPGIQRLGYVSEEDLPSLTAGATAFVYPSLYEGFGLPVAQALAAGVPVITSGVSSLPEVAGEAALFVDPHSAAELRCAIERIALSPSLRADLAMKARARAGLFRWEECARKSLAFLEYVAGK